MSIEAVSNHNVKTKSYNSIVHLSYALLLLIIITAADFLQSSYVNPDYLFRLSKVLGINYFVVFLLLVSMSFMGTWYRRGVLLVIFFITSAQWISFQYFGTYIRPNQIILLLPDFTLIAKSFLEVLAEMYGIFCLMGLLAFSLLLAEYKFDKYLKSDMKPVLFIFAITLLDFQFIYRYLNPSDGKVTHRVISRTLPGNDRLAIDNFYRSATYLTYGMLPKIITNTTEKAPALPEPEVLATTPDVNVFFIVNETVRASSLSILGYDKFDTTPRMKKIKGLLAAPVYSSGTMTRTSYAGMMHRLKHPWIGSQFASGSNCLFRLAKKNGFKTHFMSSFGLASTETLYPFMCATSIDEISTSSDAPLHLKRYDRNLFDGVQKLNFNENNFAVVRLLGAHSPYNENAPDDFKLTNNAYLNSIIYTDYSMERLIEIIRKKSKESKKPAFVISTSDHGELLEGEGELRGHGWFHEEIYTVPFFYLPVNVEANDMMRDAEKVRSHFDVSTLVLKALGYDVAVEDNIDKQIFINGSDVYGLTGRVEVVIKDGKEISKTKIKNGNREPIN